MGTQKKGGSPTAVNIALGSESHFAATHIHANPERQDMLNATGLCARMSTGSADAIPPINVSRLYLLKTLRRTAKNAYSGLLRDAY